MTKLDETDGDGGENVNLEALKVWHMKVILTKLPQISKIRE